MCKLMRNCTLPDLLKLCIIFKKKFIMNKIPKLLIYSRIVFGMIILVLCNYQPTYFRGMIIGSIFLGLVSDIFDGIVARNLGISTPALRRLDSTVDQVFWLMILIGCYLISPIFFKDNYLQILIILVLEGICYLICFVRFKKEVATHALASKLWTLILFATLIQVIAAGNSVILFQICFYLGILTRLEIIAMLLIIRVWTNDIPTVYHAVLIRKGIAIKRHKLFNG